MNESVIEEQWLLLKEKYPIGYKFSAKVVKIKPFGVFVEITERPHNSLKLIGLINIGFGETTRCQEGSQRLPLDNSLWPKEDSDINCVVSYYCEHYKQIGLGWLGF